LKRKQRSREYDSSDRSPAYWRTMLLKNLESLWHLRIPNSVTIKIHDTDTDTVFDLAFAKVMKERSPARTD